MTGFYKGVRFQRGYGVGNTLKSLYRLSIPVMKAAAGVAKKQMLKTSIRVLRDVTRGKTLKNSLQTRLVPPGIRSNLKRKLRVKEKKSTGSTGQRKKRKSKVIQDIFQRHKL